MSMKAAVMEPTMEEVLASIRQIIEDDIDEKVDNPKTDRPDLEIVKAKTENLIEPEVLNFDEVLNLTDMVTHDGAVVSLTNREADMAKEGTAAEKSKQDSLELTEEDAIEEITEFDEPDEEVVAFNSQDQQSTESRPMNDFGGGEDLLSSEARAQTAAAFSSLNALNAQFRESGDTSTVGNKTVEQLMQEILRPLLKEWLDANLPSLVKWLVTEQIEKMLREKQAR